MIGREFSFHSVVSCQLIVNTKLKIKNVSTKPRIFPAAYRLPRAACRLLAAGCWLLATGSCLVPLASCLSPAVYAQATRDIPLTPAESLHVEAEKLLLNDVTGEIQASGQVRADFKGFTLLTNEFSGNLEEGTFYAKGVVTIFMGDTVILGEEAFYNYTEQKGHFYNPQTTINGVFVSGKKLFFTKDRVVFERGTFTTCNLYSPHYHVDAKKIKFIENKRIVTRNVSLYLGRTRIFVLPYGVLSTKKEQDTGGKFPAPRIGYNRGDGVFLGISARMRFVPPLDAVGTLYYPVERSPRDSLLEGGWEYSEDGLNGIVLFGKRRVKSPLSRRRNLTLSQHPFVEVSGRKSLSSFEFMGKAAWSALFEEETGVSKEKSLMRAEFKVGNEFLITSLEGDLSGFYEKNWYDGKERTLASFGTGLVYNEDLRISYLNTHQGGVTPFEFDRLALTEELKVKWNMELGALWRVAPELRYDLKNNRFYDVNVEFAKKAHCIEPSLNLKFKQKSAEIGIRLAEF